VLSNIEIYHWMAFLSVMFYVNYTHIMYVLFLLYLPMHIFVFVCRYRYYYQNILIALCVNIELEKNYPIFIYLIRVTFLSLFNLQLLYTFKKMENNFWLEIEYKITKHFYIHTLTWKKNDLIRPALVKVKIDTTIL